MTADIEAKVRALVASAPPLTDAQRDRISALMRGSKVLNVVASQ